MALLGLNEMKFSCPNCDGHLRCDLSLCGTTIVCPHCKEDISIPRLPSREKMEPANKLLKETLPELIKGTMNEATIRMKLMDSLKRSGCHPINFDIEPDSPLDMMSHDYLNMVIEMNRDFYNGYRNAIQSNDPAALDAAPAQELFRAETRLIHRDWPLRWMEAGGQFYAGGRMIALKNDPIWTAISAFGQPYPPFDYGSGIWVRDILRPEAIALGLINRRIASKMNLNNDSKPPFISIGDLNISAVLLSELS